MYLYLLFIFFFKQKTAYEMRISDWSSDVCSSDLQRRGRHVAAETDAIAVGIGAAEIAEPVDRAAVDDAGGQPAAFLAVERGALDIDAAGARLDCPRIGDIAAARQADAVAGADEGCAVVVGDERAIFACGLPVISEHRNAVGKGLAAAADRAAVGDARSEDHT